MGTGMDEEHDGRPERPPTRAREPSPIDAQRQPVPMRRSLAVWRTACLVGVLVLVTAALWRDDRRAELIAALGPEVADADGEQAVTLLVVATFAVLALLLLLTMILVGRLARGGVPTRVALTVLAVLQAVVAPFAAPVLTAWQWEGFVTTGLLALQAVLAAVGAMLMWLPGSRRP
ncbi:hypothetical protein O9K63_00840 [Janibacter cremeus]|uniref:hypothetical protein n=1 Tax=Janibacter cremeus TaxID=1285192 RepID=UPI0023F701B4|nr:hypothetical protein [Janibacter cremeus]WEV78370.1 hypothetical protein O9K63_00840 [Janibacter cremeus]